MYETLTRITDGMGEMKDLELLKKIGAAMIKTCLCALGRTAPNPVLTTLRYFEDEYLTHIKEKTCPALVCKALIKYQIDPDRCKGCALCAKNCPAQAIIGNPGSPYIIDQDKCIKCGTCVEVCPFNAIMKLPKKVLGVQVIKE